MSAITTTVFGAYPKIGDDVPAQSLRRALHQFDRGEIDQAELDAEFDRTTERAVREMEAAGIDVPNHGCIRWDDLFAPFVRLWSNVSGGALERFFDNNTYYRVPVVTGALTAREPATLRELEVARAATARPVKGTICGPLTFARLADDRHYRDRETLAIAAAQALRAEVDALAQAGCDLIDVEEPALARWPEDLSFAAQAYRALAWGTSVRLGLHLPMFPADAVADRLGQLPFAQIGLDLRSRPTRVFERLALAPSQRLVLGVVDARNTRLETPDEIARLVDDAARAVDLSRIWISPTTSLEYVPHDVAREKLRVLVEGASIALVAGGVR